MNDCSILVIGAGASGMAAALSARRYFSKTAQDASVVILERNTRVGKKLLTTGNGRCNLSNINLSPENFHGKDSGFSQSILCEKNVDWVLSFFSSLGIECVFEKDRIYPLSLHSASVLDGFRMALVENDVHLATGQNVIQINKNKNYFITETESGEKWRSKALIAATGGMAAPASGSNGNGYAFLEQFSHKLITPLPAIVQLKSNENFCKSVSGIKINGRADLFVNGKQIKQEYGEILFTDYGLSGPPILQLSGYASRALAQKKKVDIQIDFIPEKSQDDLLAFFVKRQKTYPDRTLEEFLTGFFHRRISYALLKKAIDVKLSAKVMDLNYSDLKKLTEKCKSFPFPVTDTTGFQNAQVTAGGIDTSAFNPDSLASNLCDGLFACGEILDVDGDCGGYNLHWAWTSGYTAGKSAAGYVLEV